MILRTSKDSVMFKGRHYFYLFLLALSIRLFYFYQVGQSPFSYPLPGLDPSLYHQWAISIAGGGGMGEKVYPAMPLYPYFLGLLYTLSSPGLFWALLIQCFLGAFGVLLVYAIGQSLFNAKVAWIAALIQTFSGTGLFYETLLVPASFISFLFVLTLFLLLRAAQREKFWNWMGAGLWLGITTLAHAGIFLFLPFLFIWRMVSFKGPPLRKGLPCGVLLVCVLLAVSAVFFRNLRAAQDPVFFTAHGGINFYIGNHAEGTGRFVSPFSRHASSQQLLEDSQDVAEKELGRPLKASEASRFWFRKSFRFIRENPRLYLKLLSRKLLLFWNAYEIPDVEDYHFFRSRFSVLKYFGIPFGWIAPLGLLGILVGLRHLRRIFLLYGFLLSQIVGILLIFVNSRYRAPLVFSISLFAAYGAFWLTQKIREKSYRKVLVASFCLLHLVFLTQVDIGSTQEELQYYNIGIALDFAGDHEGAIREFKKALLMDPEDSLVLFAMGNAYFRKRDFATARTYYEKALSHHPDFADAYFNLGLLDFHRGNFDKAEEAFQKSASLKPDRPDVYYLLSAVYQKKGLLRKAEEAKERALALGADPEVVEQNPAEALSVR